MNIHEYQAKQLLKGYGLPVADGVAVFAAGEAEAAAKKLPGPLYVVKSQIHAGGRGKGRFAGLGPEAKGGVRLAKSSAEVAANAREMLGRTLVTKQTGPAGKQVNRLYVEDGADIDRELYLSILVDRSAGRVAFVVSTEGGMDIEAVAHDTPEKIVTLADRSGYRRDRRRCRRRSAPRSAWRAPRPRTPRRCSRRSTRPSSRRI